MRKGTARELYHLGVKGGPDLPLSDENKVELAKAAVLNELDKVFPTKEGYGESDWLRILKRLLAKGTIKPGHYHEAIKKIIAELEAKVKNG